MHYLGSMHSSVVFTLYTFQVFHATNLKCDQSQPLIMWRSGNHVSVRHYIRMRHDETGKSKLEASQLILHLSRYGALILSARWMLISVSQHSTASLCNFDTLIHH